MSGIVTKTEVVRILIAAGLPASSISAGAVTNDPLVQSEINPTVFWRYLATVPGLVTGPKLLNMPDGAIHSSKF